MRDILGLGGLVFFAYTTSALLALSLVAP